MSYDGQQRREFFRVEDHMLVEYQVVPEEMTKRPITGEYFKSSATRHLLEELDELTDACQKSMGALIARDPEWGKAMEMLCRRVGILTELVVSSHEDALSAETQPVTISEGGLSFMNTDEIPAGSLLALQFVLPVSNQVCRCFARVTQCSPQKDEAAGIFAIGVEYIRLSPTVRSSIARFVMQKQFEDRQ